MAAIRRIFLASLLIVVPAFFVGLHAADPVAGPGPVELTEQERHWLARHPVIRVAPDPDFQPVESLDENGRLVGISMDYLNLLEKRLPIRFRVVPVSSWDEAIRKARNREADIFSAATKSTARARYMSFTAPHIELPGVIIVRSKGGDYASLNQLRGKRVGVVSGYVWQEWITRDHPGIKLKPLPDVQTGLLLVSFGELDAMVGNLATATHFLRKLGITNLRVAGETGYFARLAIGSRNDWPELNAILQKAVAMIGAEEKQAIIDKWIHLETSTTRDTRTILFGVLIFIGLVLLAVAGNILWNHSLRRRVRRQSQSLSESEERYRLLVEASPDALLVTGRDRTITFANTTAAELFRAGSVDRLIGMNMLELLHPDERADVEARRVQALQGMVLPFAERRRRRLDGSEFFSESRGVPFIWNGDAAVLIVVRDITQRKMAEDQLRHSQKMEAVGQLTSGVAHDFNNLLTVVLGNAQILQRNRGGADAAGSVDAVMRAAQRGADLTHRLLAFSRQQSLSPEIIDLNALVAGTTDMLQRTLGETIEIETKETPDVWPIEVDPGQLENALLNLAINARDAMPGGGRLVLETANVTPDDTAGRTDIAAGDYATLTVTDTGCGMTPEVLKRVVEPFFTTKDVGEGSGLGLSMVYGFAAQSGGGLSISSEVGRGTKTVLYLPRASGFERGAATADAEEFPRGRGETLLLVEDEAEVRELTAAMLGDLGYRILEAGDGREAIEVVERVSHVDLMICDVVLGGGISGPDLVAEIRRRDGAVGAMFISGYPDKMDRRGDVLGDGIEVLGKPFMRRDLAMSVRRALDRARAG